MTTPADEIRTAADTLLKLTADATPGPWSTMTHSHIEDGCRCLSCHEVTGWLFTHTKSCDETDVAERNAEARDCAQDVLSYGDAQYAAALHPGVGAAIAAWLQREAFRVLHNGRNPELHHALAVARAINGTEQP